MTVLQEIIENFERRKRLAISIDNRELIIILKQCLEKEKQQIIDAYNEGWADMSSGNCISGDTYFSENY